MPSELPTLPQERSRNSPPPLLSVSSNSACVKRGMMAAVSAQRTQWAPGCSRGWARSPLTPANWRNLARLISHSECLVWVVPCRNPAMTLVPGSPLQPLTTSFVAHLQEVTARHKGKHPAIREEFQPSWLETFELPAKTPM